MHKLIMGIVDFRERHLPELAERFRKLALGQSPDTLFITCADSHVVPSPELQRAIALRWFIDMPKGSAAAAGDSPR